MVALCDRTAKIMEKQRHDGIAPSCFCLPRTRFSAMRFRAEYAAGGSCQASPRHIGCSA